jgi:hypothetical protein
VTAKAWVLLGGRPVFVSGPPLEIDESTPLAFALPPGVEGRVFLADDEVPLVAGRADQTWVDDSRSDQWVGELDLVVVPAGAAPVRPRVLIVPRRTTREGFDFLVEQFRAWAGPESLGDPAGRTRIWAELAPRVPRREEELALVTLALMRRALPAFAAIRRAPATTPAERREWSPLDRTAGRRVDLRRLHPFDPPRPFHAPREGRVATVLVEPSPDRAENRFVAGVVRRLLAMAHEAAIVPETPSGRPDSALRRELEDSAAALAALAAEPPWPRLVSGAEPRLSFLLRDHPHYGAFRLISAGLDDSLHLSPLPGDPGALGLRTQTINALFEVWVSQAVRAAVRRRLGLPAELGRPLPRGGAEETETPEGRIRVAFDRVYPRGSARAGGGIVALTSKRSPDAVVEWWPSRTRTGRPVVLAVDATWSRNPTYHQNKLGYARSLAWGDPDPLTGTPRLVTRHSLVVFPGESPATTELGYGLSLGTISAPPSPTGWEFLAASLDRALEEIIPPNLTAQGFVEISDLRAR